MGWQDAPVVTDQNQQSSPAWMSAPPVSSAQAEPSEDQSTIGNIMANFTAGAVEGLESLPGMGAQAVSSMVGLPIIAPQVGGMVNNYISKKLSNIGINPSDVQSPTEISKLARFAGQGVPAAFMPAAGVEGTALNLGRGMVGTVGAGEAARAAPDELKPLAGLVGGLATGIPFAWGSAEPTIAAMERAAKTVRLADDFAQSNVSPSGAAAAITGSPALAKTQGALEHYLTSAGVLSNAAQQTLADFRAFANRIAGGYGEAKTQEQAGEALQKGTKSFIDKFNKTSGSLYDNLDNYIKPAANVPLTNTASYITGKLAPFSGAPNIQSIVVPPRLAGILSDIKTNDGQMFWNQVKDLRSMVGQKLSDIRDDTGIGQAHWKQLYGALSQDMESAANQAGPQAAKAFTRANDYYRAGRSRIDNFVKPVADSGIASKAVNLALTGSKGGGEILRALKKSMPSEDWGDFAGYQLRKMGDATPGAQDATGQAFSPQTFLTNWSKLAPEAKDAMFYGNRYAPLRTQLDRLVRMSGAMKQVEQSANVSRTAGAWQTLGTVMGSGALLGLHGSTGMATYALELAAPWATAKLLTSPKFVQTMVSRANTLTNKSTIASLAKSDPSIADALGEYQKALLIASYGAQQQKPEQPMQYTPP